MSKLPYIEAAEGELGQKEIPGDADNPRIVAYLKVAGMTAAHDEVAWCAAFVNWCLLQAKMNGTHSARALSFLYYGVEVDPRVGAIAVLNYGSGKGHVAFVVGQCEGKYVLLGGNQSNSVCYKLVSKSKIATFRLPIEVDTPAEPLPEMVLTSATEMSFAETR